MVGYYSLVAPIGAYLFFKEGAVCLLIGFPILFVCGFAGVLIGRLLFKSKTAAMNLSVIPVLLIATLAEGKMRQGQQCVEVSVSTVQDITPNG